ncbi:MarR family winged helix-turn-helix transcriptional regulator [Swaminathania salitolerans]|uniref:MarR family transcriptional regulator n=1 Tax=Swaminathania salitolerans TaxID=182838 RepID=A0A511BPE2_9PROT|nr:MarR family transcriptional regulator [Swaminathania salitolerans]GBQ10871.1 MarR family transcriptional regulator [Swaminathania salitolerans LMG 21291]GEL02209.1 MarR family transcriptional regulator [Swaminathania salitolerans]
MSGLRVPRDAPGQAHLYLREEQIRQTYEAMLLAWRELGATCEPLQREYGLGAAHHRVLFLVSTHQGLTMSDLLRRLNITKQSLNRVLQDLMARGLLEQRADRHDRRLKRLHLTVQGGAIEEELFASLRDRMTSAYRAAGGQAVEGFRRVLATLQGEETSS